MAAGFSITITAVDRATSQVDAINKRLSALRAPAERLGKSLSKFTQLTGLSDVAKGFERMGRGAYAAFQSIGRIVAPLAGIAGAVSVAGMYRLAEAWAQWGSQLGFVAARIGVSVEKLQELQGAAYLSGSSAADAATGLQALGQSMYDAIGGRAPETVALFNQLGIAFDDGTRHARSVAAVLPELANKIAAIKDPYTQARIATQLFGGAAESLLPFLRRGSRGIADLEERSRRYGVTSAGGVAAANKLREAHADLVLSVQGLTNSIAERLAPILAPLLDQMANWISKNRAWIATGIGEKVGEFAAFLKTIDWGAVVTGLEGFAHRADAIAQAFGGWKRVLESIVAIKLAGWAFSAIAPFTAVLRLLALVPGSGVTAAGLTAAGISTVALTGAGIGDSTPDGPHARFRVSRPGQNVRPTPYGPPQLLPNDGRPNWLDRQLQALGIEGLNPQQKQSAAELKARTQQALAYYQSQGRTRAQAAGIVANIQSESGLNPNATGDSGRAYGLGQWHPDRQQDFANWSGHDIRKSTFEEQLAFYNYELTQGKERFAGHALSVANTAHQAGSAISKYDERPRDEDGSVAEHRGDLAESLFNSQLGKPGADGNVNVTVQVQGAGVQKVTTKSSGNVNSPKVMTSGVGSSNGGT